MVIRVNIYPIDNQVPRLICILSLYMYLQKTCDNQKFFIENLLYPRIYLIVVYIYGYLQPSDRLVSKGTDSAPAFAHILVVFGWSQLRLAQSKSGIHHIFIGIEDSTVKYIYTKRPTYLDESELHAEGCVKTFCRNKMVA